jgi:hypothetical protein
MVALLAALRARNALLDGYCAELGRDFTSLAAPTSRAWPEFPSASADALNEFLDRYREVGVRRFIFLYADD